MGKAVKPRTNLLLDTVLFLLVVLHLAAAFTLNVVLHTGPDYETWHRVLGFTGVSLAGAVSIHLACHLPWIKLQLRRLRS